MTENTNSKLRGVTDDAYQFVLVIEISNLGFTLRLGSGW